MSTAAQWTANGRLVDPTTPGICVHMVGTTPDMWCSSCRAGRPNNPPAQADVDLLAELGRAVDQAKEDRR